MLELGRTKFKIRKKLQNIDEKTWSRTLFFYFPFKVSSLRARICKRLKNAGLDSKESIPPTYIACMAGQYDKYDK